MDAGIKHLTAGDAGFTLIELIIVVTVLSILTVSVGLSMSFGRSERRASDDAALFQRNFNQLQEVAIYSGVPRGLSVSNTGWQVAQFDQANSSWQMQGQELRWQGAAAFRARGARVPLGAPDVVFLPDGHSTPFEITLSLGDNFSSCTNDGWTGLLCDFR